MSVISALSPKKRTAVLNVRPATLPSLTIICLAVCDILSLALAGCLAVLIRTWTHGTLDFDVYARLWAGPALFLIAYASVGLYPGVGVSAADELRRLTLVTTIVYIALSAAIFFAKEGEAYSRGAMLIGWGFSLLLVPLCRGVLRMLCAKMSWWGFPAVVLGDLASASMVITRLSRNPRLGLKPVVVLDDSAEGHGEVNGVPIAGRFDLTPVLARDLRIPYAIICLPSASQPQLLQLIERYGKIFPHLVVVPELFGSSLLWLTALDVGGMLGLEVKQRLLLPGPRRAKRAIDLLLILLGALPVLPVLLLIALLVKATSRGPVFYSQERLGQGARRFQAWKFRSMVVNADGILQAYLDQHPEQLAQWQQDRKLKHDPRITVFGRLLRRTSLDELPQLWNVIKGDMSLVGPRPIVQEEVSNYTTRFRLYGKLKPGMTGLWQVSGRNDTTYAERVDFDSYYVRNWSVWLDLVILTRTIQVVVFGRGAY